MLHAQVHRVEEVGSVGDNMREVVACEHHVEDVEGAEEDTCTGLLLQVPLPVVGGDAPVLVAAAEAGMDKLLLLVSVGMAGEQEGAGRTVAAAGDAMRLPGCKVRLAIGKEEVVVDLVEYPFAASSEPVAVLLESVSVLKKKSQASVYNLET